MITFVHVHVLSLSLICGEQNSLLRSVRAQGVGFTPLILFHSALLWSIRTGLSLSAQGANNIPRGNFYLGTPFTTLSPNLGAPSFMYSKPDTKHFLGTRSLARLWHRDLKPVLHPQGTLRLMWEADKRQIQFRAGKCKNRCLNSLPWEDT